MTTSIDKVRLPPKYDRRKRVTPEIRKKVIRLHEGGMATRAITREMDGAITRRTVQYIINPNIYARLLTACKKRREDGRYKETTLQRKLIMREHRAYKRNLLEKGLIS